MDSVLDDSKEAFDLFARGEAGKCSDSEVLMKLKAMQQVLYLPSMEK